MGAIRKLRETLTSDANEALTELVNFPFTEDDDSDDIPYHPQGH